MKTIFLTIILFFVLGCGYKPSNVYIKDKFGDKISVTVDMFSSEPESSVNIKDLINQALINKIGMRIDNTSSTKLIIHPEDVKFEAIQKDNMGYTISYRAILKLNTEVIKDGSKRLITSYGNYDFNVQSNSSISEQNRYDAIKKSSIKAVDELLFKLSLER